MSQPIYDQIRSLIIAEVDSYNVDPERPEFEADVAITIVPTAEGPALAGVVAVAAKGLLLGSGRIVSATVDADPLRLLDDEGRVKGVVAQAIHQVREMRSQALGQISDALSAASVRG